MFSVEVKNDVRLGAKFAVRRPEVLIDAFDDAIPDTGRGLTKFFVEKAAAFWITTREQGKISFDERMYSRGVCSATNHCENSRKLKENTNEIVSIIQCN